MSKQMQGKVCVITGGAGSIGAASAKLLLSEGAKVMLVDLSEAALTKVAAGIGGDAAGDGLACCAADVTKSDQVGTAVAHTVATFGKIDVLFSNAGNFGTVAPIADYPEDVFDSVLAVHIKGAFLCAKHAVPQMNDGGSIILNSAAPDAKGDDSANPYAAINAALQSLAPTWTSELRDREIRVSVISADTTETPGINALAGMHRPGPDAAGELGNYPRGTVPPAHHVTAQKIADTALFLAVG